MPAPDALELQHPFEAIVALYKVMDQHPADMANNRNQPTPGDHCSTLWYTCWTSSRSFSIARNLSNMGTSS
ncbi:hypothetical protein, partial [Klebsiella variicola]|uniref:hypothetical protein n=1 Tax=Klebsiella variicola TaxID=244366 RepID=UPI0027303624